MASYCYLMLYDPEQIDCKVTLDARLSEGTNIKTKVEVLHKKNRKLNLGTRKRKNLIIDHKGKKKLITKAKKEVKRGCHVVK